MIFLQMAMVAWISIGLGVVGTVTAIEHGNRKPQHHWDEWEEWVAYAWAIVCWPWCLYRMAKGDTP